MNLDSAGKNTIIMSDEANYKATLALDAVHKIRDDVHAMRVDLSVMQQKSTDHHQFITDRIKSLADSVERVKGEVEGLTQESIQRKGFLEAVKTIFFKHPIFIQIVLVALIVIASPGFIKSHFLS